MPYRRAWIGILALLLLSVPAFWPAYWSSLATVPWQYHVHGISATLWLLLLIAQSWTIHHGRRAFHKRAGLASFALIPWFAAGGLLVVGTMANGESPFYAMYGDRLAALDLISVTMFLWFTHEALRNRRIVALHGGYMVSTVFFLVAPTLGRLMPAFVPGLTIRSWEEAHRFGYGLHVSHGIALLLLAWLYAAHPRARKPFVLTAAALVLQSIVFETAARTEAWDTAMRGYAAIPPVALLVVGVVAGALVAMAGWRAGTPSAGQRPPSRAPQPVA